MAKQMHIGNTKITGQHIQQGSTISNWQNKYKFKKQNSGRKKNSCEKKFGQKQCGRKKMLLGGR